MPRGRRPRNPAAGGSNDQTARNQRFQEKYRQRLEDLRQDPLLQANVSSLLESAQAEGVATIRRLTGAAPSRSSRAAAAGGHPARPTPPLRRSPRIAAQSHSPRPARPSPRAPGPTLRRSPRLHDLHAQIHTTLAPSRVQRRPSRVSPPTRRAPSTAVSPPDAPTDAPQADQARARSGSSPPAPLDEVIAALAQNLRVDDALGGPSQQIDDLLVDIRRRLRAHFPGPHASFDDEPPAPAPQLAVDLPPSPSPPPSPPRPAPPSSHPPPDPRGSPRLHHPALSASAPVPSAQALDCPGADDETVPLYSNIDPMDVDLAGEAPARPSSPSSSPPAFATAPRSPSHPLATAAEELPAFRNPQPSIPPRRSLTHDQGSNVSARVFPTIERDPTPRTLTASTSRLPSAQSLAQRGHTTDDDDAFIYDPIESKESWSRLFARPAPPGRESPSAADQSTRASRKRPSRSQPISEFFAPASGSQSSRYVRLALSYPGLLPPVPALFQPRCFPSYMRPSGTLRPVAG